MFSKIACLLLVCLVVLATVGCQAEKTPGVYVFVYVKENSTVLLINGERYPLTGSFQEVAGAIIAADVLVEDGSKISSAELDCSEVVDLNAADMSKLLLALRVLKDTVNNRSCK